MTKLDLPVLVFPSPKSWAKWLEKNHAKSPGIWLRFYKRDSGAASVTYPEALDEALCHGWIDGQLRPFDAKSWLRRFTPRRPRSPWSKINTGHVARLTKAGRMKPAGLAEVRAAQADGRWKQAYDSSASMKAPRDFLRELAKNKKALAHYKTLNRANLYAIAWRLQTAKKPETRARRMRAILAVLAQGQKLH